MGKIIIQKTLRDMDHIDTLSRMLERDFSTDKIAAWLGDNGYKYTIPLIKQTFKKAKKEDMFREFIPEEDIQIGDKIRSRQTGREGKVNAIKNDGDTIIVTWSTGGNQLLAKEAVFKLTKKNEFSKVHTTSDPYGDMGL